jgi:hypothetical protein
MHMRRRLVFAAALLLIASATGCGPTYDVAGIGRQPQPHGQLALIVGMARREARQLGDRHVSEVLIARGTRAEMDQALRVGSQPGDDPGPVVWVFEIRGHFICDLCSRPAGARSPRGTVAAVVLDRHTLRTTDFSLGRRPNDLGTLGRVWKFPL